MSDETRRASVSYQGAAALNQPQETFMVTNTSAIPPRRGTAPSILSRVVGALRVHSRRRISGSVVETVGAGGIVHIYVCECRPERWAVPEPEA